MGIEDRDYHGKDRKLRTRTFNRKDVYYHPKEYRRDRKPKDSRPLNDWAEQYKIRRQQWAILIAFVAGGFVTFWGVMVILHVDAELLWLPVEAVRKALHTIGRVWL